MDTIDNPLDTEENSLNDAPEDQDGQKKGLRASVNAHCRDCIYDDAAKGEGTWRQQVEKCLVSVCALYQVRPVSKPKKKSLPPEE